ncbi:phage portal protein [Clostridium thermosuccinogenes]|uniref:phage portal protein n=1 Tax=Clostridium thermosuccinogenes TaxID=84032 RepID=UPI000CCC6517|nr:phage portal protein [Pseudoclostridium thermosuccinogenes]PNT94156.1 phage portal protein [Pseudoclostridium thermosuccinogenes]
MPTVKDNIKICMDITDDQITPDLINKLLKMHEPIVSNRYKILDDYYRGKHEILKRTIMDPEKPNHKPVSNFCSYITDTLTGFFIGKPVTYTSNNKQYLDIITQIFEANDEKAENHDLAHKASIKGQAFELVYLDEDGNICFDCLDTDSVIMVYGNDIKNMPVMAIRYYTIHDYFTDKDTTKIDVYTKTNIYHYTKNESSIIFDSAENHYFKDIPIIEYPNNRYRRGDFENIITLNDMYNLNLADIANDIAYYSNCYLILENMSGTTKDDLKVINENKTILTPENGKAYFLTKQLNDQVVNNHRNNLAEDIHKISYVPDLSKEINTNVSGAAIRQRFFNTSQVIVNKERKFKKALQTRLKLITNILNLKGYNFNYKDIEITFNQNLPINLIELSDSASKFAGIVSRKTLLSNLPFVEDVDAEMEQIRKEQSETINLDLIPDANTGGVYNE